MPRIEVLPNTSTVSAPGWAYVAVPSDGYLDPSKAPIIPSGARSRAKAAGINASAENTAATTSRQQAAIAKRLAELDRDSSAGKDIPIPNISAFVVGDGGSGRATGKTTSTRKILSSAKTFANYLADEEAARALTEANQASASANPRSSKRKSLVTAGATTDQDMIMTDAPDEDETHSPTDEGEARLLATKTIAMPSQAEIDALLAAPALSYNAAKAAPPDGNGPPARAFCEICGYWGRVRCVKCGVRVCGLDCKEQHMVECSRRYA